MCTYVIWEEFWKGIELPVSPLISDCSLCKREPWHLCKGSRGLSLVSRNQFELSLLEIYIFHSACAIQLVFLISDWSLAGTMFLKAAFFQKVRFIFQISKSRKKNIPISYPISKQQMVGSFKLRIVFWNIFFFGDLEIWKAYRTFRKKPPLSVSFIVQRYYKTIFFQ